MAEPAHAPFTLSDRIESICDSLGPGNVSVRRVRAQMEGKGSFRDIQPVVRDWRMANEARDVTGEIRARVAAQVANTLAERVLDAERERKHITTLAESERKAFSAETQRWRHEIAQLRAVVTEIGRQVVASPAPLPPAADNVINLTERSPPLELNTALGALNARLDKMEKDLAEQLLPAVLKEAVKELTQHAETSAKKIVDVLDDLPQTLRQAPLTRVDTVLNDRLEKTILELTHHAAVLAKRKDHSSKVIDAIELRDAAAARRQTRQARLTATAQDAMVSRIDALLTSLSNRQRRKTTRKKATPARRAKRTMSRKPPKKAQRKPLPARRNGSTQKPRPAPVRTHQSQNHRKPTRSKRKTK